MHLYFYTGKQCHLCNLAQELVDQVTSDYDLSVTKIDVKSEHQLTHLYGARIPVLKRDDNKKELGWPFDVLQLKEFLD